MPQDQCETQKAHCPQAVHTPTATKPHHATREYEEEDNNNGESLGLTMLKAWPSS